MSVNSYANLYYIWPEIIVSLAGFLVLLLDIGFMRGKSEGSRHTLAATVLTLGFALAACWLQFIPPPARQVLYDGMLVIDSLSILVKEMVLILAALTTLLSLNYRFTLHVGEFYLVLALGTVGMMFLISSEHLLMIFLALELLSLSLYLLAGFDRDKLYSAEAALKYFLFGGASAACMLYGLSFLYGITGQLNLSRIAGQIGSTPLDTLTLLAIILVLVGFGFKVAAAPFHFWAPDAYQGAPVVSAAFIASGSKVASFFILGKVLIVGLNGAEGGAQFRAFSPGWIALLALLATASLLIGNLAAIAQRSVRRLLAYSAVAQAGYMLIGLMADNVDGFASLIYYSGTYALTVLGAFAVVGLVQTRTGGEHLSNFAGLARRAPVISLCMMVFLLSLAGIPPLAGFFGKFYLFVSPMTAKGGVGYLWLICLAIAMSAVSLYYYLQVLKQMYIVETAPEEVVVAPNTISRILVVLLALAVVVLGCVPNLLVNPLLRALRASGF